MTSATSCSAPAKPRARRPRRGGGPCGRAGTASRRRPGAAAPARSRTGPAPAKRVGLQRQDLLAHQRRQQRLELGLGRPATRPAPLAGRSCRAPPRLRPAGAPRAAARRARAASSACRRLRAPRASPMRRSAGRPAPSRASRSRSISIRTVSTAYSGMPSARPRICCAAPSGRPGHQPVERARPSPASSSGSRRERASVAPPRPNSGRRSASSGRARASTKSGCSRDQSSRWSRKSSRPASAYCTSSNTRTSGPSSASRSKNSRQAANRSSRSRTARSLERRAGGEPRADPAPAPPRRGRARKRRPRASRAPRPASSPQRSEPHADHLGQRPERDAVAVGQAAAAVPPDRLGEPVDVLLELPGQPRLADAGAPGDRDQLRAAAARRGAWNSSLTSRSSRVAADERRLEAVDCAARRRAPRRPARARHSRHRLGLALERVLARVLEPIGRRCAPPGRLVDQHLPGLGRRLHARRRC